MTRTTKFDPSKNSYGLRYISLLESGFCGSRFNNKRRWCWHISDYPASVIPQAAMPVALGGFCIVSEELPSTKFAPAFDFYPERWTHGTRHMTKVERCDYLDLLCHQWTEDGLPPDPNMLARLIGYRKGTQISTLVLDKFPECVDGKRRNQRLEIERHKQRVRMAKAAEKARKGAAGRWHGGNAPSIPQACLEHDPSIDQAMPKQCPPPTSDLRPPTVPLSGSEAVEKILKAYPRTDSPMQCVEAIRDAIDHGEDPIAMLKQVRECAFHLNSAPGGHANVKMPSALTFFSTGRWRQPEVLRERVKELNAKVRAQDESNRLIENIPTGV